MKKLFAFILCFGTMPVWAANMCVKNDTVMVVLDPTLTATQLSHDNLSRTWSGTFDYGPISGIAGCYAKPAGVQPPAVAPDQTSITIDTSGTGCFCKMLRPVVSKWIYVSCPNCVNDVNCPNACPAACRNVFGTNSSASFLTRQVLFGSIGT